LGGGLVVQVELSRTGGESESPIVRQADDGPSVRIAPTQGAPGMIRLMILPWLPVGPWL